MFTFTDWILLPAADAQAPGGGHRRPARAVHPTADLTAVPSRDLRRRAALSGPLRQLRLRPGLLQPFRTSRE